MKLSFSLHIQDFQSFLNVCVCVCGGEMVESFHNQQAITEIFYAGILNE